MPVILRPADYEKWLSRVDGEVPPTRLLRPYPAEEMIAKEAALHRTQAELQSANALLKELVVTDALTGLYTPQEGRITLVGRPGAEPVASGGSQDSPSAMLICAS